MSDDTALTDRGELLHRQVHPHFIDDGHIGTQAFKPTTKDESELSISLGSLSTAEEAFVLYTTGYELPSAGVWSVTVEECGRLGLLARPDPLENPVLDSAHGFIDFRETSRKECGRLAKRLAAFARERGCQYSP